MKTLLILTLTLLPISSFTLLSSTPTHAQSETPTPAETPSGTSTMESQFKAIEALSRAKNLARQAAETANGGLSKYRAELSMHRSAAQSPYKDQGDHWVFTFKGSVPGATDPSIESEVRVDKSNFNTTVLYNGAIRSAQ